MKKKILKTILFAILTTTANAQIIFENNVDNLTLGEYSRDELIQDWDTTSGNGFIKNGRGESRVTIIEYGHTGQQSDQCIEVKYPANKHDSKASGAQWKTKLNGVYNELYMSYYLKVGPNFGLDKIGKLPGFGGGLVYNDSNRDTEWSGKLMWREGGRLQFYLNQPVTSQNQFDWPRTFNLAKEQWYHIELHYKMNTPGVNDGIMEAWLDGEFISKHDDVPFRTDNRVGITEMFFSTFYGGNEIHEPEQDNYAYFDDFKVSTQRIGYNEPVINDDVTLPETWLSIQNKATGLYLNSDNKKLTTVATANNTEQIWRFVKTDNYYNIESKKTSGEGRGVLRGVTTNNSMVVTNFTAPNTSNDKQWEITKLSNDNYNIKLKGTNKYLTNNTLNTTNITELDTNGDNDKSEWIFNPSGPTLSIIDQNKPVRIAKIYPNPATNTFKISLNDTKEATILITNLLGKIVYKKTTSQHLITINKTNVFKTGIYIIKITDNQSNNVQVSKLVFI